MNRLTIVIVVVAAAIGFLVWQGLGNATLYFKTADEAVRERDELGDRRFRIEGAVLAGSVKEDGDGVDFRITAKGVEVAVRHRGDPPELFQPDIPVVLEGRWQGTTFESDRIMVRHSSEYREDNPDRVRDYPT